MSRPSNEQIAKWYSRIFRTALRMTGSADDATDLTQQTFCRAIRRWDQFQGEALPTTWLHKILVNCVRDWARRRSVRSGEVHDEWAISAAPAADQQAHDALERHEQLARLRGAIAELPDHLRVALVATVIDGYTYDEAAQLLDVPIGTVASRVHEARKRLTTMMKSAFGEVRT